MSDPGRLLESMAAGKLWSRPKNRDSRGDYFAEQEEQLSWGIDQAVTRGLIDPREAEEAKAGNESTWWDRMFGFKDTSASMMGEIAQPIIDVLSLGTYAAAATTRATINDPLLDIGGFKLGFTPSAWLKAFRDRPVYSDMFDSFAGGLAFDIALDPMTYLTFGVGPGVKIGVGGVKKIGATTLAEGAGKLSLTRHGKEIYDLAARKFRPVVEGIVNKRSEEAIAAGQSATRHVEPEILARMHDDIGQYMVENYEQLALESMQQKDRWSKFKNYVTAKPQTLADQLMSGAGEGGGLMGKSAEDMFQETARAHQKDYGIGDIWNAGKKVGEKIGVNPYVDTAFRAVAPNFHRKLGVPVDIRNEWFKTTNGIKRQTRDRLKDIEENLSHLSHDELSLVTRILDAGEDGISRHFDDTQKTILHKLASDGTHIDPKVLKAVEYSKGKFKEIVEREQREGFKIEEIKDYVERVYKTRDARAVMMMKVRDSEVLSGMTHKGGFQFHRTIASLEESIELFGQTNIDLSIGSILAKREAASIRMVEMEKFYDYVKATSGLTPLMVYQAGNEGKRTASMLKKILHEQHPKEARIIEFDQLLAADDGFHKKVGFITDEAIARNGGTQKNIDLLDYLSNDFAGRHGGSLGALISKVRPNAVAMAAKQFQRSIKFDGKDIDLIELLRMEYGKAPVGIYDFVKAHFADDKGVLTAKKLDTFLRTVDAHMRKELDTPLLYMFPDLMDKVKNAAKQSDNLGKKNRSGGGRSLRTRGGKDVLDFIENGEHGLRRQVHTAGSFVPQLPEEFVLRAKMARMRYGDYSDISNISKFQAERIQGLQKKLGLKPENLNEVIKSLVNKESIGAMSSREADKLIEFMGIHADEFSARTGKVSGSIWSTSVRKVVFGQRATPYFDSMEESVASAIEDVSKFGLEEVQRKANVGRTSRQIEGVQKTLETLNKRLEDLMALSPKATAPGVGKVVSGADDAAQSIVPVKKPRRKNRKRGRDEDPIIDQKQLDTGNNVGENAAKIADQISVVKAKIKQTEDILENLAESRKRLGAKRSPPAMARDERQYIPNTEVLGRNADNLSEAELGQLTRKKGLARKVNDARKAAGNEAMKPAFEARKALRKELKPLEKELNKLTKLRDEIDIDDVVDVDADTAKTQIADLNARIAEVENKIAEAIAKARAPFETNLRLLGNSKYLDKNGKVRDIIVKETSNGTPIIMGNDAQELRKAIAGNIIDKGDNNIEYLMPALQSEIPDNILGTNAGTYWIPEDVARFLEDVITPMYNPQSAPMVNGILKAYDRIQTMFKVPLLAPWASTMARNSIGNVSIAYLRAGLSLADPEYLSDFYKTLMYTWVSESPTAAKLFIRGKGEAGAAKIAQMGNQVVKALGDNGNSITIKDLVDEMGKRGVMSAWMSDEVFQGSAGQKLAQRGGGAAAGAVLGGSVAGPAGGLVGAGLGAMLGKESYRMSNLFRFQELASEIPTRLMLGINAYKQTGNLDETARVVRHYLHDYSELSTFERRVVRRGIPFYNFTKLAFRVVGTSIFDSPGRLLLPHKIFQAQNISGLGFDQAAMPEDVPDWFHDQMSFIGKNIDEETGKMKTWIYSGFNLPIQEVLQLTDIVAPGGRSISQLGSRGGFLATSVMEYLFNFDTFRGGPIYPNVKAGIKQTAFESGTGFVAAPDWMKKLVGFQIGDDGTPRVDPRISWALGEVPTSRFLNLSKKIWEMDEEGAKQLNYSHLATQLVGIAQYRYDPETQEYFQNRKKVEAMTNVLANIQHLKSYSMDRSTFKKPEKKKKISNETLAGLGPLMR